MNARIDKQSALSKVETLVARFKQNEADYNRATYNETQARTEFVTPLLEAFGWDVHNVLGLPLALREVIEEATVEIGEERLSKKPDYELRLARQRKIFVEAKKPSVRIDRDRAAAFQTRRYGYSGSLPISVLTNFQHLAVYDCRPVPNETDDARIARHQIYHYEEYVAKFDELWNYLSREVVYSGEFDKRFAVDVTRRGAEQFDDFFLGQVRSWRERLATDIHANNPDLSSVELTYAVQLFLSRIVFLRICEDREIERYENLKGLPTENTFTAFMNELRRADEFYDSGLFRLIDDQRLNISISDDVLLSIVSELYYPRSPYTFAVVETEVLGEIYEQFLSEVISVVDGGVEIITKSEVRESGGIVPTPRYIADVIVDRTLAPLLAGKSPADLGTFTVADICCGSGTFLLSAFDYLLDHYLSWYSEHERDEHNGRFIYEASGSQWRLTYEEKRRILETHIRGVDIDPNAVEVTRFSLLLKLIENESAEALGDFVLKKKTSALPELDSNIRCGNSLVSESAWNNVYEEAMPAELVIKVNPFDWSKEFGKETTRGGFDAIVGNPPYIRIQNMATYSAEEVSFYKNPESPYKTAHEDNFDKYSLFVERALSLLTKSGRYGAIVPHKFMNTKAGQSLRRLLTETPVLEQVIHFGVKPVFGRNVSNYTCILVLDKAGPDEVRVELVDKLEAWRYGEPGKIIRVSHDELSEGRWALADVPTQELFNRVRGTFPRRLSDVADIFVGVQTSADEIYIFRSSRQTEDTVYLSWDGREWPIERAVLRPCLHDLPLQAYSVPSANAWMIFPYELVQKNQRTQARLIQPEEMQQRFPNCLAYLEARRDQLSKRNVTGGGKDEQQFYQFGRSQSLVKFGSAKIILPILSLEPRYAFDDQNIVVTGGGNGPYYMIRPLEGAEESMEFLLAVLNHPLSEAIVRTNTSTFRGGYYSHGKQYIAGLPIPTASSGERSAIDSEVRELIAVLGAAGRSRVPHETTINERRAAELRNSIERRVSLLFGLSEEDLEIVRAVPIPS